MDVIITHFKAKEANKTSKLIKAGGRKTRSEINKHINSTWNNEELSEQWKKSIIAPIYEKGNKTDYSKQRGISIFSST